MKLNFRQGLVQLQSSPNFITLSGGNVHLNSLVTDNIITFAHGDNDYIFSEGKTVSNAWRGPFNVSGTSWLFWDLNIETGVRTFGKTSINPLSYGDILPSSPTYGQNFFYTIENKMKVWDGVRWKTVLRVFAGEVQNNSILVPYGVGSQINNSSVVNAGYIIFDERGVAIKSSNEFNYGNFIHSESRLKSQDTPLNQYNQSNTEYSYTSELPINAGLCVSIVEDKLLTLSSYRKPDLPCVGISVSNIHSGEVGRYVTEGFIKHTGWNFTEEPNSPIWVGSNGEVTQVIPEEASIQRLGYIVSSDTIMLDIQEPIILDPAYKDCIVTSPTPTPTPTVTPTNTPTSTVTPTVTPTNTAAASLTPSATASATVTPTATVTQAPFSPTPTVTSTVTPVSTVTPTITPTMTVTPNPSITPTMTVTPTNLADPTATVTPTITPTTTVTPTLTPTISG